MEKNYIKEVNMSKKLQNAKSLYMEGIRDGNAREAITKYTGARYTQHSTGVKDGVEGFVEFFEPFIERNPKRHIQIVRGFEDGQYVFVQAYQSLNDGEAKWVTADIFDTDENDRIIEHWDVIQSYEENAASGHSILDGATDIEDLEKTAENKALITNFCETVLVGGQSDKMTDYIAIEEDAPSLKSLKASIAETTYVKTHRVIGQGNFVAAYNQTQLSGEYYAVLELFRIKDGKIVEHWDVQEKILPEEQWGNSGKF